MLASDAKQQAKRDRASKEGVNTFHTFEISVLPAWTANRSKCRLTEPMGGGGEIKLKM